MEVEKKMGRACISTLLFLILMSPHLSSAQDYELDVTMGDDGMPSEFYYADERMSFRVTVDVPSIKPWYDNTATVDVIIDEAFHPEILSSKSFGYWVLGKRIPLDPNQALIHGPKQVELKTPYHLILRGLTLQGIRPCELKIVQMPGRGHPYPLESALRKPGSPLWSIEPIADDMEIAKAFDLLLRGNGCVQLLERARGKAEEKQMMLDDSQRRKEMNAQEEDILLLTNQRLLQCAFDPVCEKKVLAGVDQCEKTEQRNYVESCIRAIKISP
jgi:hypothetical protein